MKQLNMFYECHVTNQESGIWQLKCHLHIINLFEQQIVIVSPQNCEIGWFITAQVEQLATHVVCDFDLDPTCLTWIEYDADYANRAIATKYSEIEFQWRKRVAKNPRWKGIADDLIEDLIDNVFTRPQIRLASLVGALR
jgi:hypothetical protein